ncbi:hypothetical protein SAMN04488020_10951 [Palleronia marisminoris]|uniref:sulfite exporter TauE/SafE family protein n=1 Tax=Palleronia marisminoris TaxID=315423 RepID=UPI0008F01C21|nr:sulfite exporter TauE/SafE family protein [Palleronia marisminoris]SFH27347.1 hypothetical protein SAMN04488020_10951 [Palleronia marisminoris]
MIVETLCAVLALVLGGVLKGATGAGAPIIAVPIIAMLYDVPLAVAILAVPSLLSNVWQAWSYRRDRPPPAFVAAFAGAGAAGAIAGTIMLANLPSETLLLTVAGAVFAYIAFRLLRPDWVLSIALGQRLAAPAGFLGGVLQGASGVSAPVSITFLNAMKLERPAFIGTITLFFVAMSMVQIPMLVAYGFMSATTVLLGLGALGVIVASMPLGTYLAQHVSREAFDRTILVLLALIALRLVATSLG